MKRREFVGALPLVVGGTLAITSTKANAQTQSTSTYISVKQFGAVGNGTADDTAAITAAFTYASGQAYPICVFFPDGEYLVSAGFTIPVGVTVRGSGRGSATIVVGVSGITVFSCIQSSFAYANITVCDLGIQTSKSNVIGMHFTLCEMTCVERVLFAGCTQSMTIDRGQHHQILDVVSRGYSSNPAGTFRFWSSVDTDYIYHLTVNSLLFSNSGTGVSTVMDPAAIYLRRGITSYFSQVIAGDLTDGGAASASFIVIENDCQGCKFSQCIGVYPAQGIVIKQGSGVAAFPEVIEFNGVDIDQPTVLAIQIVEAKYVTYNGGTITPRGGFTNLNPIVVYPGGQFVTFNATTVSGFSGGAGFFLNGGSYIELNNCIVDGCSTAFVFAGGDHIRISGGSVTNCTNKYSGAYNTVGSYYRGVYGFNPFAVGTPALPPSGATLTNNLGVRCSVYMTGGNITALQINGQAIPSSVANGAIDLEPGDSISVTYSTSPSWTWIGH
ncbi:glycosyl hydrolase family 28-related protein [Dyella sp. GSA-30]|uniref:glycosyl hydrolase family 28-related protein n=1 Tax=Dyella sp. GSA-30 TaxID=2994496 RepID=UPI00249308DE|nr:glycosyl hydrolase family 28-related protein [Dyella sp. GSA-30]